MNKIPPTTPPTTAAILRLDRAVRENSGMEKRNDERGGKMESGCIQSEHTTSNA